MDEFTAKLDEGQVRLNSLVCVGLDSEFEKIPEAARRRRTRSETQGEFNCAMVDATKDLTPAYKFNLAPYIEEGAAGMLALHDSIAYVHVFARNAVTILDTKWGDVENTNMQYARAAFDYFKADALTVHTYFGGPSLRPFFERKDKGIFVVCRSSSEGAEEIQCELVNIPGNVRRIPLYQRIAARAATEWNANRNCGVVVGAKCSQALNQVRRIIGDDMPILSPEAGAQGANVGEAVKAGINSRKRGLVISSSRSIIFASSGADYVEVARQKTMELRDESNRYR